MGWMNESRVLLGKVYNYDGFILDKKSIERSKSIVEKQLFMAAARVALMLDIFPSPTHIIDFKAAEKVILFEMMSNRHLFHLENFNLFSQVMR